MFNYIQYLVIVCALILFTKVNMDNRIVVHGMCINFVGWMTEWLLFTLLASLRIVQGEYGGADAQNYIDCFLYGYEYSGEKLFYLLGTIIRSFTDNYHVYFMFTYGIIVAGILSFAACVLKEENKKCSVAILFLYFNMYITSFGVMRQWLAVAIGMIAIVAIKKKHEFLGFILMLIAGFIHFTMLSLLLVLMAYYIYSYVKNCKINNTKFTTKAKFYVGIICNLVTYGLAAMFISIVGRTEYASYVSMDVLGSVSWLGYIPTIIALILFIYYEKEYNSNKFSDLMVFFLFAHWATIYIMVGLGMFRLMCCFFAIRVWGLSKLQVTLCKRFKIGSRTEALNVLFDFMILVDGAIYMWRTIGNGALPLILDI